MNPILPNPPITQSVSDQLKYPLSYNDQQILNESLGATIFVSGNTQITSGNSVTITDPRITTNSVIMVSSADRGNYTQLAGSCSAGSANINVTSPTTPINVSYLIKI